MPCACLSISAETPRPSIQLATLCVDRGNSPLIRTISRDPAGLPGEQRPLFEGV